MDADVDMPEFEIRLPEPGVIFKSRPSLSDDGEMAPREMYYGKHKNDQRHGLGVYYYETGNVYRGNWHMGEKDGYGAKYYTNG
jgi:hypothetical protein